MLKITHSSGFFSCCSVKLFKIINYFNKNQKLPDHVDSSEQFKLYKPEDKISQDITFEYFQKPLDEVKIISNYLLIDYEQTYQYLNYKKLNFFEISPFVKKYFSPSNEIVSIINNLETKYAINYSNICVLFYRGNDKITETRLCPYTDFIERANEILKKNPDIQFLIQSDETEFIETMLARFPKNSFYFKDEIRHMKKCKSSVDLIDKSQNLKFSKLFLAITILMSKCSHIIFTSGNCSIWIVLYRGNTNNVQQFLDKKWL